MAYVVDPFKRVELSNMLYESAKGSEAWGAVKYGISRELADTLAYDILKLVGEAAEYRGAHSQRWIEGDATQRATSILGPLAVATFGTAVAVAVGIAGLARLREPKRYRR